MSVCVCVCECTWACPGAGGGGGDHSKVKGSWVLKKKCPSMWSSRASFSLSAGKRSLQMGHSFHGGVAGPPVLASDKGPTAKPLKETEGKERVSTLQCPLALWTSGRGTHAARLPGPPVPHAAAPWRFSLLASPTASFSPHYWSLVARLSISSLL